MNPTDLTYLIELHLWLAARLNESGRVEHSIRGQTKPSQLKCYFAFLAESFVGQIEALDWFRLLVVVVGSEIARKELALGAWLALVQLRRLLVAPLVV